MGLGLREQDANADLFVEDAEGNALHERRRPGTANEWLAVTMLAGTYYVRLEAQEAGVSSYMLRYGGKEPDPFAAAYLELLASDPLPPGVTFAGPAPAEPGEPLVSLRGHGGTGDLPDNYVEYAELTSDVSTSQHPGLRVIDTPGDVDWFQVGLSSANDRVYLFEVTGSGANPLTLPKIVGLYRAAYSATNVEMEPDPMPYTEVLGDSRDGNHHTAFLLFDPQHDSDPNPGSPAAEKNARYYIAVTGADGTMGSYSITSYSDRNDDYDYTFGHSATFGRRPGVTVNATTPKGGYINFAGDEDWFSFEASGDNATGSSAAPDSSIPTGNRTAITVRGRSCSTGSWASIKRARSR